MGISMTRFCRVPRAGNGLKHSLKAPIVEYIKMAAERIAVGLIR